MKNIIIKILRGVAIVFMSLTVLMTLLGGVGTTCIAWNADKYGKAFAMFIPYMPPTIAAATLRYTKFW